MTCRENCIHWRVCENINDPYMSDVVNGNEAEKLCTSFLELKQGTWKFFTHAFDYDFWKCSECGRLVDLATNADPFVRFPYCHCGAMMTEEE